VHRNKVNRKLIGVFVCMVFIATAVLPVSGAMVPSGSHQSLSAVPNGDSWSMFRHDVEHTGYSPSTAPNTDTILWSYSPPINAWFAESSPVVSGGKVYIGACAFIELNPIAGIVYCLDEFDGSVIWTYSTDAWVVSSPAVADGKVYAASFFDGKIHCLDANDGDSIWSYTAAYQIFSSPAVTNGNVYIGSVDFQENKGEIICLDATDGDLIWKYVPSDGVYSSPAIARSKVYMSSNEGSLYCFCDNLPPDRPSRPSGPASGKPGIVYNYTTSTTDPNGDDVRYGWDWDGDEEVDEWTSFYPSGVTVTTSHSWEHMGIRLVRVKAEDTGGFQSEWSKPLLVITPDEHHASQHSAPLHYNTIHGMVST